MRSFEFCLTLLFLSLLPSIAFAETKAEVLAGVYKVQVKAQNWQARGRVDANIEDILEIIPRGEHQIYFRIHLENPVNGKICGLSGIAHEDEFSYEYQYTEDGTAFELSISQSKEKISGSWSLSNPPAIASQCPNWEFPVANRRKIRYADKILQSRQFKEAVAANDAPVTFANRSLDRWALKSVQRAHVGMGEFSLDVNFVNGKHIQKRWHDAQFIGALPRANNPPFLIFIGRDCRDCDAEPEIQIDSIPANFDAGGIPDAKSTLVEEKNWAAPGTLLRSAAHDDDPPQSVKGSPPWKRYLFLNGKTPCTGFPPHSIVWYQHFLDLKKDQFSVEITEVGPTGALKTQEVPSSLEILQKLLGESDKGTCRQVAGTVREISP